jgi:hypothetical protein
MSQQGKGVISQNDLMSRLVQAKKVMNVVDSGNFERGNVNESIIKSSPEEIDISTLQTQTVKSPMPINTSKIQNSNLPDAIKRAMIENPIPTISLNDTLDMEVVKGAKRLMEQEGIVTKGTQKKQTQNISNGIDMNSIAVMIENTVRKVLDEKLNQILTAQQTATINENLVLKVGDSIFKGKITGVNKAK